MLDRQRSSAHAAVTAAVISLFVLAAPTSADAEQNPNDVGLYVAYCPEPAETRTPERVESRTPELVESRTPELVESRTPELAEARSLRASAAGTSEAGWPKKECLKMDKGPAGRRHTLVGMHGVHNWLLGGYGNDTIIGGNVGDVIWADYQPSGEPKHQTATIHAGNGRNVIYANDTVNYVWTGTNPRTVVHAHASGISGTIHCQSPGVVLFLSTVSEHHFKLDGCHHISHYSVGY